MAKILAVFVFVFVAAVMLPHLARGEWITPTLVPPGWWGNDPRYDVSGLGTAMATPAAGYGFGRFDAWNTPSATVRPATKDDFRIYAN